MSPLSIILLSRVKKSSGLNQERNLCKHHLQEKAALNMYMCGLWCERQEMIFSLHEALLWILARYENFKLKHPFVSYKHSFSLLKTLTDGLEWCVLLWCYYQTLILTAPIHSQQSIRWWVMQCYISPNLMKKQTHLHLGHFQHIFLSGWTIPLNLKDNTW